MGAPMEICLYVAIFFVKFLCADAFFSWTVLTRSTFFYSSRTKCHLTAPSILLAVAGGKRERGGEGGKERRKVFKSLCLWLWRWSFVTFLQFHNSGRSGGLRLVALSCITSPLPTGLYYLRDRCTWLPDRT